MKLYSPGDIADLLQVKDSTVRKYSSMLEKYGYEFEKNSRKQRFYRDSDVVTLRKLVTFKENGMTLEKAVEGVMLWHKGNESQDDSVAVSYTNTHSAAEHDSSDIAELKNMMHKQQDMLNKQTESMEQQKELIKELTNRLDRQQYDIGQHLLERDQALMEQLNTESQKQIASAQEEKQNENQKESFWKKLFKK